ncbi:prepilin-type N-terminal cleavage/methylation domain-containing protein, partial [archaeon]|nr:prepilin-type N-terminal cleavage/methylation domain-containing protein [archaeon]
LLMRIKRSDDCRTDDKPFQTGSTKWQISSKGVTLVELILVMGMIGVLSGIAVPAYTNHADKVKNTEAIATISSLEMLVEKYNAEYGKYPDSLSEIGKAGTKDPWGKDIQYLNMKDDPKNNKCRKLGPVHPLNTDYDLYSSGKDGKSNKPINSGPSRDDIIRAYNGNYIGSAQDLI